MKKLLILTASVAIAASAGAGNITVKGSDTMVILAQKWAETYMSKNSGTKIQVTGGGSGIGLAALQNKTTDSGQRLTANQAQGNRSLHQGVCATSDRIQSGA